MLELTPELLVGLPRNGPTDPIEFYRRPLVGRLYRERINMGLRLLDAHRFERVLEIGYGAGAVLLTVAPSANELHGIDLDADPEPVRAILAKKGYEASLVKGSVYALPYADGFFDLVICYSVFEHLHEYTKGLEQVRRVLAPGGLFLLGMPAVNKAMEWGFRAIGFKGIEDHHVTTPAEVAKRFDEVGFRVVRVKRLGTPIPVASLYTTWLLERVK